jgi:predicted metal-dependent hydrolase
MLPSYKHIINPKLKHTYLSIDDEGTLIIKSPIVSQQYISKLLISKAKWINQAREKIANKKGKLDDVSNLSEIYLWGKKIQLTLIKSTKNSINMHDNTITIHYNHIDKIKPLIYKLYKQEAQSKIPNIVEYYANKMQLIPNKLSFRKTKRQWGSCSANNNISLNTMLAKLPQNVVKYIVVHELAHIKHKNHQKEFWALVERYMPEYKQLQDELKTYTT